MSKEEVITAALQLGLEERAELAHALLRSLDKPTPEENERLWLEEAERRLEELRSGAVKGVPLEEAFRHVKDRFSSRTRGGV